MEWFIRLTGLIPLAVVAGAAVAHRARKPSGTRRPQEPRARIFALELVRSKADVDCAVGDLDDERRKEARLKIRLDYVLIALYGGLFAALSVLLAFRDPGWALWLGIAPAAATVVAAASDVVENRRTERVLDEPLETTTDAMASAVRQAALVKFAAAAATVGLLAFLFWAGIDDAYSLLFASALIVAALGFAGLLYHRALKWFFGLSAAWLLIVAAVLAIDPARIEKELL
jgi:hypothetical protein